MTTFIFELQIKKTDIKNTKQSVSFYVVSNMEAEGYRIVKIRLTFA